MQIAPITDALARLLDAGRTRASALIVRARETIDTLQPRMRALRMVGPAHSPEAFDWLAVNASLGSIRGTMQKTDLDAVAARRAMVAREIAALEQMRSEMEAEDEELAVAERVLRRLADMPRGDVRERVREAAIAAPALEAPRREEPVGEAGPAPAQVFSGAKEKLDGPIRE